MLGSWKKYGVITIALFLVLSISNEVKATHITGGDISYECIGQDSFLVTLNLFRDCAGIGLNPTENINFTSSCGSNLLISATRQSVTEISQLCPTSINNSTCNGGNYTGIERHTYTTIAVLSPPCNSWTMSWSSCCRNQFVVNLINPGSQNTYIDAVMYSGTDACNRSPYFTSSGTPTVIMGQPAEFNFGAVDLDGDSLVYAFESGKENTSTTVTYAPGYTYLQPIQGNNITFNSITGQYNFTPTTSGNHVVNVRVDEYDKVSGAYKGSIKRDVQINVITSAQNQPGFAAGGLVNNGDGVLSNGVMNVCDGDSLDISITVSDANSLDVLTLTHNVTAALDTTALITITGTNPSTLNVKWLVNSTGIGQRFFRVQAQDNACPYKSTISKAFKVRINKGTYAGEDKRICAGETVTLNGSGGTTFTWVSISGDPIDTNPSSPGYNMTCSNCVNPQVFPSQTTQYVLVSNITSSCGNTDTVTVSVSPDFSLIMPNDTVFCPVDSLVFNPIITPATGNYSYQWTSGTGLSNNTIRTPNVFTQVPESYTLMVTSGFCTKSGVVNLTVANPFPVNNMVTGDSVICTGQSLDLGVQMGTFNVPLNCGLSVQEYGVLDSVDVGSSSTVHSGNFLPDVYNRTFWGTKHQFIFRAGELNALGFSKGKIKSISFDLVNAIGGSASYSAMEIKIGCVGFPDLTGGWVTNLSTVLSGYTHSPSTGWDELVFTSPYDWDGTTNLVVEVCFQNSGLTSSVNFKSKHTNTSFTSSISYGGGNNVCNYSNTPTPSTLRPNIRFKYLNGVDTSSYSYSWIPNTNISTTTGMNTTVNPSTSTTYSLIITDLGGGCSDTIDHHVTVTNTAFDAGFLYDPVVCLNEGNQTFMPLVNGGIFTGTGVSSTGVFNPAQAGVGQWPINYNIPFPAACSNDSTVLVNVIGLPDASINYTEVCQGSGAINLTAATLGGVWSGQMITDSVNGTFNAAGLPPGQYEVIYTLNTPCYSSDTSYVKIIEPYSFNIPVASITVCENESVDVGPYISLFNGPNQGIQPMITYSDAHGYVNANGIFDATGVSAGSYLVTIVVSDSLGGCAYTRSVPVVVREIKYAGIIADPSYCTSQSDVKIFVQPWLYGAGVSYTQRPLGNLGVNDTLNITPFGQNGQFNPQTIGVGSWEITLTRVSTYGCVGETKDTIYVLDPPDTTVTNTGLVLTANAGQGYMYQWLDCDRNMLEVSGATQSTYTPGVAGSFAVRITAGNCEITSSCHDTWPVGVIDVSNSSSISIYPNPVEYMVTISAEVKEELTIEILDNTGKRVYQTISTQKETKVSMVDFASGVYLIKVTGEQTHYSKKIVKN